MMKTARSFGFLVALLVFASACGSSTPPVAPPNPVGPGSDAGETVDGGATPGVVQIALTPAAPRIAMNTFVELVATGTFDDGTTGDISGEVTWSTSDASIATVDPDGTATGLAPGTARISATLGALSAEVELTVTDATLESLAIEPLTPSLPVGMTQAFTALGTFSDGSAQDLTAQVSWVSSAPEVAAFSADPASPGLIEGLSEGETSVTASREGVSAETVLTVTAAALTSMTISPPSPQLAIGTELALSAEGTFSDGTTRDLTATATWASSDPAVATVSDAAANRGLLSGVSAGTTSITATVSGIVASASAVVTSATLESIAVEPATSNLAVDATLKYLARGTFSDGSTQDLTEQVTWASSDPGVATISNAAGNRGEARGVSAGTTEISATFGTTVGTAQLTVVNVTLDAIEITPANPSIVTGTSTKLEATAVFSDGSRQNVSEAANWTSSDAAVASVSNAFGARGTVTGNSAGSASISASVNGVSGSTTVTVADATLVSIAVTPNPATVPVDYFRAFTATGTYDNGVTQDLTTTVTWASSDTAVLQVSNTAGFKGEAQGVAAGTATLTATHSNISGSAAVTVTNATLTSIAVTPTQLTLASQDRAQLTATGTFSDMTTLDITEQVTWSSSSNLVVTVSNFAGTKGELFAIRQGMATITAAADGKNGTASVTVTP